MSITRLTSAGGFNYSGSGQPFVISSSFTATVGSLIVLAVRWSGTQSVSLIADSFGNTYTQACTLTVGNDHLSIWYAYNTGSGSTTVAVVFSANTAYPGLQVAEYSGIASSSALDATATGSENIGSATVTTGSFSTDTADELSFSAPNIFNLSTTWTAGSGYSIIRDDGTLAIQEQIFSSIQSGVTASASNSDSGSDKMIALATFRAAGGGGVTRVPRLTVLGVGG